MNMALNDQRSVRADQRGRMMVKIRKRKIAMKKLFLMAALLAPLSLAAITPADAKVNFQLYLGVPHYDYRVGPDYSFRPGYGWYDEGYRGNFRGRISCGEARRIVRENGYRNVRTRECNGSTYTFRATRPNGRTVNVYVNARSGSVSRG
jgi:hypothetical protein